MVQELLHLLPTRIGTAGLAVSVGGAAVGLGLWLAGARFSRSLLALVATAAGGIVGARTPGWFAWPIDPMATAVAGALVVGIVAFFAHEFMAGVGLGTVAAVWAALATLAVAGAGSGWTWPAVAAGSTVPSYLGDVYHSLPHTVAKWLPFACGVGLACGGAVVLLWRRVGVVLLWSMAGLSLALGLGMAAARVTVPGCVRLIPSHAWAQALILAALVAFGAVFQWNLAPMGPAGDDKPQAPPQPSKAKPKAKPPARSKADEIDD